MSESTSTVSGLMKLHAAQYASAALCSDTSTGCRETGAAEAPKAGAKLPARAEVAARTSSAGRSVRGICGPFVVGHEEDAVPGRSGGASLSFWPLFRSTEARPRTQRDVSAF